MITRAAALLSASLLTSFLVACGDRSTPPASPASPASSIAAVSTVAPAVGGPTGVDDCAPKGGSCVAVSECGPTSGHLIGEAGCGAVHLACCSLGADSCGGRETWSCCREGQEARPVCRDGGLTCSNGWVTGAIGGCAAAAVKPK